MKRGILCKQKKKIAAFLLILAMTGLAETVCSVPVFSSGEETACSEAEPQELFRSPDGTESRKEEQNGTQNQTPEREEKCFQEDEEEGAGIETEDKENEAAEPWTDGCSEKNEETEEDQQKEQEIVYFEETEKEEFQNTEELPEETQEEEDGHEEVILQEKENIRDFVIEVLESQNTVKAGDSLLYEIRIENTGSLRLENLVLEGDFQNDGLTGGWSTEGTETEEEKKYLDFLEPGQKEICYLNIRIPEEREEEVRFTVTARADCVNEATGQKDNLSRSTAVSVAVIPLKVDFQVTKTADRTRAAAGDQVLYQICIRNTGERTLHSVVTTENFQMENVSARFLEKEGVQINQAGTKALISRISPGQAVSLQAAVTLPERLVSQELINEVQVVAAESGKKAVVSQAKIQVFGNDSLEETQDAADTETAAKETGTSLGHPVRTVPKTGDETQKSVWLCLMAFSALYPAVRFFRGIRGGKPEKMTKTKD